MRVVRIHYRRPPDRLEVFEQQVVAETSEVVVTYLPAATVTKPISVQGRPVLEPGSPIVWFTYPRAWHDIGRFHLSDGSFTGFYANILTPVQMDGETWQTTDLFLDVWLGVAGEVLVLDGPELDRAVTNGWVDSETASLARAHADELANAAREQTWPPAHAIHWDLERVRRHLLNEQ